MAKSEQIKNEEINYAEKAAEHIKLQEQFAERVGESYWRVRQKRIELTGFRERQAEIIRQKIAKLDELLTGVDWQAEDARKKLEENFGVREKIEKEEKAFTEIQKLMNELAARENELVRENFDVRRERQGLIDEIDREVLAENELLLRKITEQRESLFKNPETALLARMAELAHYQKELSRNNFAVTPSRKEEIRWIERKIEEGQPIFLEGPTGTGKTELAKNAARELYGDKVQDLDLVIRCTQRTGPADIFGKILLRSKEGTETYFQPGKFTVAVDNGVPVIFDEINNMESSQRLGLKEFYNTKPGNAVSLQEDSGKAHTVQKGFTIIVTANLKGEKHKSREELGTEETRVFAMRHIDYMPREELYDLCLVSMMGREGQVWADPKEIAESLKNLCDAVEEIQDAYNGNIGAHYNTRLQAEATKAGTKVEDKNFKNEKSYGLVGSKAKKGLNKAVLDPGQVIQLAKSYQGKVGVSLKSHLEEGLMEFVRKGDYPESDRDLIIRIFLTKGFFKGVKAADFGLKTLDSAQITALSGGDKKEKPASKQSKVLSLKEVASIDPYGRYQASAEELASDFLSQAPPISPKRGKRWEKQPDKISAEFENPIDGKKETIEINFETVFKRWNDFFTENKVDLPPDFEKIARAIWNQNYDKIKESVENLGYDGVLIIPGNLNLPDFHQKMSQRYNPTWESDNFKEGGSWRGVKSAGADEPRIVLYHDKNTKELDDNPITKAMIGKDLMTVTGLSQEELEKAVIAGELLKGKVRIGSEEFVFDGLSVEDYLAIQAEYFKRTDKHLDEKTCTRLIGSTSGRRVPELFWDPVGVRLFASADGPAGASVDLAPRPAAVFNLVSEISDSSEFGFNISSEFENLDGKKEKIEFDFEKETKHWAKFYKNHKIDLPPDFAEQVIDVLERNRVEMEKSIEKMGYDKVIIVPPSLDAAILHKKITEGYVKTIQWASFKNAGGFEGITTPNVDKLRIVLVHEKNAQNNNDHPILKELRGKSVTKLAGLAGLTKEKVQELLDSGGEIFMQAEIKGRIFNFNGLDVLAYLIWQKDYCERNSGQHIDESSWSALSGSSIGKTTGGRRVPELYWNPVDVRLGANANGPAGADASLAPRPAAVFV